MKVNQVWAVYYSATGTTKKMVTAIADGIAAAAGARRADFDFTLPEKRETPLSFSAGDLVVFGTPVYAGRVPNVLLKYLGSIQGGGALAIAVSLYGNRNYDDGLIELRDILRSGGFHPIAAGAFVGEHSFSTILAAGRPDKEDMELAAQFAQQVADKLAGIADSGVPDLVHVEGIPHPYRGYYQPRDRAGNPVDIRKVKPLTADTCDDCGTCVKLCPMGSIDTEDVRQFTGICIKCGACIKGCPKGAKYYDDAGYLYHKTELEEGLTRRAEPELFL